MCILREDKIQTCPLSFAIWLTGTFVPKTPYCVTSSIQLITAQKSSQRNIQLLECLIPALCPLSVTKKSAWPFLRNEKIYRKTAGVKTTGFSRAFQSLEKYWFFSFCILWISGLLDFLNRFLAISWEPKELPELQWCKYDRIFRGFSDLLKILGF